MWERRPPTAASQHWQLLPGPASQPEVGHRRRHLHGRAAEEAGHRRHGEYPLAPSQSLGDWWTCFCPLPPLPTDDRGLAVYRLGGGPTLFVVVCRHHHPGDPGHVPGCQLQLHTWQPIPIEDHTHTHTHCGCHSSVITEPDVPWLKIPRSFDRLFLVITPSSPLVFSSIGNFCFVLLSLDSYISFLSSEICCDLHGRQHCSTKCGH